MRPRIILHRKNEKMRGKLKERKSKERKKENRERKE